MGITKNNSAMNEYGCQGTFVSIHQHRKRLLVISLRITIVNLDKSTYLWYHVIKQRRMYMRG